MREGFPVVDGGREDEESVVPAEHNFSWYVGCEADDLVA